MQMRTLFLLLFTSLFGFGQNLYVDSLEGAIASANDSQKVVLYAMLTGELSTMDIQKAEAYSIKCYDLAKKLNIPRLIIRASLARTTVMNIKADHAGALEVSLEALKTAERIGNKEDVASSLISVGYAYHKMSEWNTSLHFFYKALALEQHVRNGRTLGNLYNNIGNSLYYLEKLDSSAYYHKHALEIREKNNDQKGISYSLNNLGLVSVMKKDYDGALDYYIRSLAIKEKIGEKKGIASAYINIADVYTQQKKFDKAIKYVEKGLLYANEVKALDFMISGYEGAAVAYEGIGDYKTASVYLRKQKKLQDSLVNQNSSKKMAEMKAQYESEKQQEKLTLQAELLASQDSKINQQKILIWAGILGVLALITLVLFNYRNYKKKKELFDKLAISNEMVERKNKDITDSIKYALRIQKAILPDQRVLADKLPDHFIYYNPRDIVSGDFYWFHNFGNVMIVASADCTGHGVPGAFMSMICVQLLNQVIGDSNVSTPQEALQALDLGVKKALHQSGLDAAADGMDIALCAFHLHKSRLQYSGAFRPLYLIRNGELKEIKANKFTIGGLVEREKKFEGHELDLQKGDCLYLFTDGFADQFGGEHGKKFMLRNFKKLIIEHWSKPMAEQRKILNDTFQSWKGGFEQVDDVLVMGIRV